MGGVVVSDERRARERFRHRNGCKRAAAPDVGHADAGFESRNHPVEQRQYVRHELELLAVRRQPLDAARAARPVIVVAAADAGVEALHESRQRRHRRDNAVESTGQVRWMAVVEQHRNRLGRQPESIGLRVVLHLLHARLMSQPLTDPAFVEARVVRELFAARDAQFAQRAIEAEPVAERTDRAVVAGGNRTADAFDVSLQFVAVDFGARRHRTLRRKREPYSSRSRS